MLQSTQREQLSLLTSRTRGNIWVTAGQIASLSSWEGDGKTNPREHCQTQEGQGEQDQSAWAGQEEIVLSLLDSQQL